MKKGLRDGLTSTPSKTTIKVSYDLRGKLAEIGNKDETFEDVIWRLIRRAEPERSGEIVTSKTSVIQYKRKTEFVDLKVWIQSSNEYKEAGFEYEYNVPPKKEGEWQLDIKVEKVYYNQKTYNPSEFFGIDYGHKYFSKEFIYAYFSILAEIFAKDFGITKIRNLSDDQKLSIVKWRKVYYENNLSEESFISDVEDTLRDFSNKKSDSKIEKQLKDSVIGY